MEYAEILSFARSLRKNQTAAETIFWRKVRNRRFHDFKFSRQYILKYRLESNRNEYFIVDFYCHSRKLVVEIDGGIHKYQLAEDKEREDILKGYGYTIIRFQNEEVLLEWNQVAEKLLICLELDISEE